MSEPTKVHVSGESKQIIDVFQRYAETKLTALFGNVSGGRITQSMAIEALLKAGYKSLTGKDYKSKVVGRGKE